MVITFDWITGFILGLELWLGDDCEPGDKFAAQISLGIVRLTFIVLE